MILDQIVLESKKQLEIRRNIVPLAELEKAALKQTPALDFASALSGEGIRIIAEIKKASPSRGIFRPDFNPVEIAKTYADNGAAAISVLTEIKYFLGSLNYLAGIREAIGDRLPLLRKDFIFDPYQVYESRAYGADSLLLIVAILTPEKLKEMIELSCSLGMSPLVEVHNETELEIALNSGAKIVGINNRDLHTFTVDINTAHCLCPLIPPDRLIVSESGIKDRSDIEKLRQWGADAVLIGEAFMSAPDIAAKMKEML